MNVAAGPELAAAVSNAGGLGVIGGLGYTYVPVPECVPKKVIVAIRLTRCPLQAQVPPQCHSRYQEEPQVARSPYVLRPPATGLPELIDPNSLRC